jgi:hypothetical protein
MSALESVVLKTPGAGFGSVKPGVRTADVEDTDDHK